MLDATRDLPMPRFFIRPFHFLITSLLLLGFPLLLHYGCFAQMTKPGLNPGLQLKTLVGKNDTTPNRINLTRLTDEINFSAAKIASRTSGLSNCNTSTFYMHLSETSGQKIELKELQTLPDGNFIIAGNIILANAEPEGLICILSNSGNIVLQKQLRINNKPVTLSTLKVLLNGKLIVAGILHDVTDQVFIAQISTNLSVDWMKIFDMPSPPLKVVFDLLEQDQIAFAIQLSTSIIYTVLNSDGSLGWTWLRQEFPAGFNELVGFNQLMYSEVGLITNCTRSGKAATEIVRIKQPNGDIISSHTIGDGTDETKYGETVSFEERQIALGVVKRPSGQFQLVRNILYSSANSETEHVYTLPGNIDFNTTVAMDNAGDIMGACLPAQGKLIFIRHLAYYQTWPEYTRQYSVPTGASIAAIARSFTDGGYLLGLNTANSGELILIKTDSIGRIAGCSYEDVSNNYTETLNTQNTISTTGQSTLGINISSAAITNSSASLSSQFDCNQNYCPPSPPDDTCLSTYLKTFRSNSYVDAFYKYYLMRNDKQLVTTTRYDRILGNHNQLTYGIKLFDEKGYFIKGVNVFCDGVTSGSLSRQVDDQHVMLINYVVKNGVPCFVFTLIDDDLQILWTKSVETFIDYSFYSGGPGMGDLVKDAEGNYYFVANSLGFNERPKVLAYKMDAAGNPLWLKVYDLERGLFLTCNATTTNTSLVVIIEGDRQGSVSVRLDKNTGQMLNAFMYSNSCDGSVYDRLVEFGNDRIYYCGNNAQSQFVMGVFDTIGRPIKMKSFDHNASLMRAATVKSGMLYAFYNYFTGTGYKNAFLKADTSLAMQFINAYDITLFGYPTGMGVSDNGSIYFGGNYSTGGVNGSYYDPYLQKFDPDGNMGTCSSTIPNPNITDINLNTVPLTYNPIVKTFTPINIPVNFLPDDYGQHISGLLCSSLPQCDTIILSGDTSVCNLDQNYTYHATKNPGCTLRPSWVYDTSFVTLQANTDSSAVFKFKRTGSAWIKARLNTGCKIYWDSVRVSIQTAPATFTLGSDTLLCPGDTIRLNARTGFNSYRWQDGSTDSVFTVTSPGNYFVRVDNVCGDVYSDTIVVSPALVPPLTIGNDSAVCMYDTLYINASPGFSSYQWQSSAPVTGQGRNIFVVPVRDEVISLVATTADGCRVYDTIYIDSIPPQPVSLGMDQRVCAPDSVTLSAGNNFMQWLWSNGQNTASITVRNTGTYWVKTTDLNGCRARDTISVQVFVPPGFNLGSDFDLCSGDQKRLDPGNFSQYVWQDGSTNRYYTATTTGTYWVKVTDGNQCAASDTVVVKNIVPLPVAFLKTTDSICQYDKLTIASLQPYSRYLWSTGSAQSSVIVNQPGFYTLTVRDANGCAGTDTIEIVPKVCNKGFFIPTAFTPNNDGTNDSFRPYLFGRVVNYRFVIYNRWGEKVFETTDLQKAWDGRLNGIAQPSFVFVWQCFYQFEGETPSFKKGTVTLIR